jgi:hypothetical protein
MEIDPILSLAITLHTNKGCYAALLGSGISRSSGIPTGWDIILDLIESLAVTSGENCKPEPDKWYVGKYGKEPNYSELLSTVAKSPTERRNLLRGYFEPTQKESEEGKKAPTKAHKALAKLVEQGFIKVIVTTNFDRLMEQALEEIGITPQVISTPSSAVGAMPIQHATCTIIKVHGDYLDTRIKNSTEELGTYDVEINALLDRVFDEYGLIICGWSGDWDQALRDALERRKGRRFSTYWITRGKPSPKALDLINHMAAVVMRTNGADEFFEDLSGRVQSLDDISRKHPLSASVAVATLKRYLAKDEHRIQLADLIKTETENAYAQLVNDEFFGKPYSNDTDGYRQKFDYYNSCLETLVSLIANGCYWGKEEHVNLWVRAIERLARSRRAFFGSRICPPDLRSYPGVLLLYAGGVAAVLGRNYSTLESIFKAKSYRWGEDQISILEHLWLDSEPRTAAAIMQETEYAAINDYLYLSLRKSINSIEQDESELQMAFDRFECFVALGFLNQKVGAQSTGITTQISLEPDTFKVYAPLGRFGRQFHSSNILKELRTEVDLEGDQWSPLQAGMFYSDPTRVRQLLDVVQKQVATANWH